MTTNKDAKAKDRDDDDTPPKVRDADADADAPDQRSNPIAPEPGYTNALASRDGVKPPEDEPPAEPLEPGFSNPKAVRK